MEVDKTTEFEKQQLKLKSSRFVPSFTLKDDRLEYSLYDKSYKLVAITNIS